MAPLAASRAEGEGLPDLCSSLMTVRPLRPLGVPPPLAKRGAAAKEKRNGLLIVDRLLSAFLR